MITSAATLLYFPALYCTAIVVYAPQAKYYRAEAQNERKHAHAILDFVTARGRLAVVKDLSELDEVDPRIKEFNTILGAALDAAEVEENYGVHFAKLFKLAYDLECVSHHSRARGGA